MKKVLFHLLALVISHFPVWLPAQTPVLQKSFGHERQTNKVVFSPDGEFLLSASEDKTMILWNGRTFKKIRTLGEKLENQTGVHDISFSVDGQRIVSAADKVRIWDRATGALLQTLDRPATIVRFSPDGKFLLTDNLLRSATTYELIDSLPQPIEQAAFGRNHPYLATSSGVQITIWQLPALANRRPPGVSTGLTALARMNTQDGNAQKEENGKKRIAKMSEALSYQYSAEWASSVSALSFCGEKDQLLAWGDLGMDGVVQVDFSGYSGYVNVWNWESGINKSMDVSVFVPLDLQYDPQSKLLLAAGSEGTAQGGPSGVRENKFYGNLNWNTFHSTRLVSLNPETMEVDDANTINGNIGIIHSLALNPASNKVVVATEDGYFGKPGDIHVLKLDGKKELVPLEEGLGGARKHLAAINPRHVRISPDGRLISFVSGDEIYLLDLVRAELLGKWPVLEASVFDNMEKEQARLKGNNSRSTPYTVFDLKKLEEKKEYKNLSAEKKEQELQLHKQNLRSLAVSGLEFGPDGQSLVVLYQYEIQENDVPWTTANIHVFDINNRVPKLPPISVKTYAGYNNAPFSELVISPDGTSVIVKGVFDEEINLWDLKSGKPILSPRQPLYPDNWPFPTIKELPSRDYLKTQLSIQGEDIRRTFPDQQNTLVFKGHTAPVTAWSIDKEGKILVSCADDQQIKIWNLENGRELATIMVFEDEELLIQNPEGYYMSTPGLIHTLGFTLEGEFYALEEFDLLFNRPDKILASLPHGDTSLIRVYDKAYSKRVQKMAGGKEDWNFSQARPRVSFKEANRIPHESQHPTVDLNISAADISTPIAKLFLWINGVPIFGSGGYALPDKGMELNATITPPLSEGPNRIEISIRNEAEVESRRIETYVDYQPKTPVKPDLYLIAMGVSTFKDSKMNLKYAKKDARDLVALFSKNQELYNRIHVDTLYDQALTTDNLRNVKTKLLQSRVDDQVIVFIASHGMLDKDLSFYLATHTTDFNEVAGTGLPYERLEDLLDGIPSRKKMLLMDACHSGEVDEENVVAVTKTTGSDEQFTFRAFGEKSVKNKQVGLENSFELMKTLFADLRRGTGTVVISAAGGAEYALEGGAFKNGIFTFSLLSGLLEKKADLNQDGQVMASELQSYLATRVPQLTNGMQQPTSRAGNLSNDWRIW